MRYVVLSAAWMGGYAGVLPAEEFTVLPLSDRGSQNYPLLEREAGLQDDSIVLLAGATRRENQVLMTKGSRLRLLQREREELRFQWKDGTEKALLFGERNGPLVVDIPHPEVTAGVAGFSATDRPRWIEITARQAASFQVHSIRYEEAQPRPEDDFRPLRLPGGIETVVTRQDGSEERFYQIKNGSTLSVSGPALLKIQTRALLPRVQPGHKPICLIKRQAQDGPQRFTQLASAASPFEVGTSKGEKIGVGYAATFYVTIQKPMVFKMETDCLINVQALATDEQTPFISPVQDKVLFAAFEHAELRPLETYRQLLNISRNTRGHRVLQGLRSQIEREDLYFKSIYPRDLRDDETLTLVRGLPRDALPDADGGQRSSLIPADLQSDCFCVRSSARRQALIFSNPLAGQGTMGRLIVPAQEIQHNLAMALELKAKDGRTLQTFAVRLDAHSREDPALLASFTFPLAEDVNSIVVARSSNGGKLPDLGLEILHERDRRLDQASVSNQISAPQKGFMETMIHGESKVLDRWLQRRLKPARDVLQRHADRLRKTAGSVPSFDAPALQTAVRSMLKEGSYSLLKGICIASLNQGREVRQIALDCLRDVAIRTEDYPGLAVVLGWQYGKQPSAALQVDYAEALAKAGMEAEALVLLAEIAPESSRARNALKTLLADHPDHDLFLTQAMALPIVSSYAASVALHDGYTGDRLEAFSLGRNETLAIASGADTWVTHEVEVRAPALAKSYEALHWIQVSGSAPKLVVPLLLDGQSQDLTGPDQGPLTYPMRFYIRTKKGRPLTLKSLQGDLYVRVKQAPESFALQENDGLVRFFPKDSMDAGYLAHFSKLWHFERNGREAQAARLRSDLIVELRRQKPLSWANAQRLRILEDNRRWVPVAGELSPAQVLREDFAAWSPDHPVTAAQKALLPPLDRDVITVVGSEEEDTTEIELAHAASLQIQFNFHALDERGRWPQAIEMKIDDQSWQGLTMTRPELTRNLDLEAGPHRLSLRFKQRGGPRFLYVRIATKVDDAWVQLTLKKAKYWAAPTPDQPLQVQAPGVYRIHRRSSKRTDIEYRTAGPGEPLQLTSAGQASYRLYALAADPDARPDLILPVKVQPAGREADPEALVMTESNRQLYSLTDAPAYSLAAGTRSNCRDDGREKSGLCDAWWHPSLALSVVKKQDSSQAFARLKLFPGSASAGQVALGYEALSPAKDVSYEAEVHGFTGDNGEQSIQGGGAAVGAIAQGVLGPIDTQTGVRFSLYEVNRDRIHPDLPQEVVSTWKARHRRTIWLLQNFEYKPATLDSFRLHASGATNPPGQTQLWDQASVVASWLRSWTPLLSTGLGYEVRYYFRDRERQDYLLRYSPRLSLVGLNYDLFHWPVLAKLQVGLEADTPRTVFALTLETPLGNQLNPDATSLRNFPFSDLGRGEIFKRHVQ